MYKKQLWKLKEKIQQTILANAEYKRFYGMSTADLPKITTENDVYCDENVDKLLISVDVKAANFRVLNHYCPTLFEGCSEWSDFIKRFTHYNFPLISKPFRVILINELDNKEGHKFPIIFINELFSHLTTTKYTDILKIVCCKNDEVVFEIENVDNFNLNEFTEIVNSVRDFFRIDLFRLRKTSCKNYFVKEFINSPKPVEFKNVPKRHIMQVIKNYDNIDLVELDFKYVEDTGVIHTADVIY